MDDPNVHLHRISVPTLHGFMFIEVLDIICCTADGSYTQFFMKDQGKNLFATVLLKDVERKLHGFDFMLRIHKSHIVNMNYAVEYTNGKDGSLKLENNMHVTVSRNYKKEFLERVGER